MDLPTTPKGKGADIGVPHSDSENPQDVDYASRSAFLSSFTIEEEKHVLKKVDRRFLLLAGLMYMVKQIDVNNAASVKVLQVGEDRNILTELNMTSDQYNWVQSIYYISYIVFEAPSNLLLKRMTPRLWQTRIFLTWGIVVACHAAIQNRHSYYAVRFILGMLEAGMFPGLMAQLASWYRTDEFSRPVAWIFAFQQVTGVLGSLICYAISYMNGMQGLSAWRWVYILEGVGTILFSGVVFLVLPDYPRSRRSDKWLTKREQNFLELRLSQHAPLTNDPAFSKNEIVESLKEPTLWAFMLSQLFVNLGGYALTWYLPTITTSLGFASLPNNQLLNIPPAVTAVAAVVFSVYFMRGCIITRPAYALFIMVGMAICFILFFTITSTGGIYAACILGMTFYQMYFIPFWAWRSATLRGSTGTAFTLAFQNCVGQVGGVVGPQLFQEKWAYNRYKNSFAIAAASIIAGVFANMWTWWLTRGSEAEVLRVTKLRKAAAKKGEVFSGEGHDSFSEKTTQS